MKYRCPECQRLIGTNDQGVIESLAVHRVKRSSPHLRTVVRRGKAGKTVSIHIPINRAEPKPVAKICKGSNRLIETFDSFGKVPYDRWRWV